MSKINKVVLIILDGWGYRKRRLGNALKLAPTPYFDWLWKKNFHCLLKASGKAVGLPTGFMGNSEVGHLNLGAGRILKQELLKINESIEKGDFFKKKIFSQLGQRVHLLGMLSDAGIHSHLNHLFALIDLTRKKKIAEVFIHVITDGRDTPPKAAKKYLEKLEKKIARGKEKIATISGRYFAMDRDKHWERTRKTFQAIVFGKGRKLLSWREALKIDYTGDEFIIPSVIGSYSGMQKEDTCIFYNFREDRARQLTQLLYPKVKKFICFYEYDKKFRLPCVFSKEEIKNCLAEVLSKKGLKQLHLAETEKYAHVTYFFNGGREKKFKGEFRKMIPSPRVSFYDKTPEMKTKELTTYLLKHYQKYDFCVVNFCNGDMLGHTGNLKAAIKGCQVIDQCLKRIVQEIKNRYILITGDHGNCEEMIGKRKTSHTLNKVFFILIENTSLSKEKKSIKKNKEKNMKNQNQEELTLARVAPTILKLMNIKKPPEMVSSLI